MTTGFPPEKGGGGGGGGGARGCVLEDRVDVCDLGGRTLPEGVDRCFL